MRLQALCDHYISKPVYEKSRTVKVLLIFVCELNIYADSPTLFVLFVHVIVMAGVHVIAEEGR